MISENVQQAEFNLTMLQARRRVAKDAATIAELDREIVDRQRELANLRKAEAVDIRQPGHEEQVVDELADLATEARQLATLTAKLAGFADELAGRTESFARTRTLSEISALFKADREQRQASDSKKAPDLKSAKSDPKKPRRAKGAD